MIIKELHKLFLFPLSVFVFTMLDKTFPAVFILKKGKQFWVFRKLSNFLLFNFTSPSATRETTRGLTYI